MHGSKEYAMSSSKQLSKNKLKENQKAVYVSLYEDMKKCRSLNTVVRWFSPPKLKTFHLTKKCLTIQLTMNNWIYLAWFKSDGQHVIWWWIARGLCWRHSSESRVWRETIHLDSAPSEHGEVAPEEENKTESGSPAQIPTCITHSITLSITRSTTVMHTEIARAEDQSVF